MKLSHDEKMILRQAANILRNHIGNNECMSCDCSHTLCDDTWIGVDGCEIAGYMYYIEDYIRIMDKCDHIERCFHLCDECLERNDQEVKRG